MQHCDSPCRTPLQAQSPACQPCPPGKFAYSWGSSYCKNCIEGTYAPKGKEALSNRGGGGLSVYPRELSACCQPALPACPTLPPPLPPSLRVVACSQVLPVPGLPQRHLHHRRRQQHL